MPAAKAKAKTPKRAELQEYFEREKTIANLRREASDLSKLQGKTDAKVLDYVRANGGLERCAILFGYRLSIELIAKKVQWQKALMIELEKHVGAKRAARVAAAIRKAAGKKEKAKIEPPDTQPSAEAP